MATQLQLRRGTTSQIAAFTGANGEIAVDTDVKTIYVQDGATAGGFAMARADFSNISASASLTLGTLTATTLNVTTLDLTTLEVTTIKAKDGTAAGSIADSTGVVTIASAVLTTADINGGTFDGVVGGTTPAAGSFTTLSASTSITGTLATAAQTNITSLGTLTTLTVDDITIDGSTISDGGDLTIDVAGNIILDADGAEIKFQDGGTDFGRVFQSGNDFYINAPTQDTDIIIQGNDGGSNVSALTFDMSDAGAAQFNSRVGIGVAAHATAGLNITSTDQNIRLNNGSELGIIDVDSDGHLILWAHGDGETIDFKTGSSTGTIAMSVVGTSVGIGATPETWNSNFKALQIGPWGSITTTTGGNGESFRVNANFYNDGSAEKYLGTGYALMFKEGVTAGSFVFSSSQASGSADGSIASWYHSEIHNHSWASTLETTTSDGSDNYGVGLDSGGGAGSSSRGAGLWVYGNEHSGNPGDLIAQMGASGNFRVMTGAAGNEIFRVDNNGYVNVGMTGGAGKLSVAGMMQMYTLTGAASASSSVTLSLTQGTHAGGSSKQGSMMLFIGGYGNSLTGHVRAVYQIAGLLFFDHSSTSTITQISQSTDQCSLSVTRNGSGYDITLTNSNAYQTKSLAVTAILCAY